MPAPSSNDPRPFIHYGTSLEFLNILESKGVSLLEYKTINGGQEQSQAISMIRQLISANFPDKQWLTSNNGIVYCTSFYTNTNLFSGRNGQNDPTAFSASISADQLNQVTGRRGLYFSSCLYTEAEKIDFIRNNIVNVVNENKIREGKEISHRVLNFSPLFKDESLQHEQEYKVMTQVKWSNSVIGSSPIDTDPISPPNYTVLTRDGVNYVLLPLVQ